MPARRGLRLLPALLLQHQSGCQQLSAICLPGLETLQAGLSDALAGGAQAAGAASRGLTSLSSSSSGCKAAPGCRCKACSARRTCKATPGCRCRACSAGRQARDSPLMGTPNQARWRTQPCASGALTADAWQQGRRADAETACRSYGTAATAPSLLLLSQRVSPTELPGRQHSAVWLARRSYSTLEEVQREVRKHNPNVGSGICRLHDDCSSPPRAPSLTAVVTSKLSKRSSSCHCTTA